PRHPALGRRGGDRTGDGQPRPAIRVGDDLAVVPAQPGRGTERFRDRLLGGEAGGQRLGGTRITGGGEPLRLGEQPVSQQRRPGQRIGEALDEHHVESDPDNHSHTLPGSRGGHRGRRVVTTRPSGTCHARPVWHPDATGGRGAAGRAPAPGRRTGQAEKVVRRRRASRNSPPPSAIRNTAAPATSATGAPVFGSSPPAPSSVPSSAPSSAPSSVPSAQSGASISKAQLRTCTRSE